MRRQRLLHALGVTLVAPATMAPPASAQGPVRLAIIAEITGGGAPSGTMWRDGVPCSVTVTRPTTSSPRTSSQKSPQIEIV